MSHAGVQVKVLAESKVKGHVTKKVTSLNFVSGLGGQTAHASDWRSQTGAEVKVIPVVQDGGRFGTDFLSIGPRKLE